MEVFNVLMVIMNKKWYDFMQAICGVHIIFINTQFNAITLNI